VVIKKNWDLQRKRFEPEEFNLKTKQLHNGQNYETRSEHAAAEI
jgi:hypothetical protein